MYKFTLNLVENSVNFEFTLNVEFTVGPAAIKIAASTHLFLSSNVWSAFTNQSGSNASADCPNPRHSFQSI